MKNKDQQKEIKLLEQLKKFYLSIQPEEIDEESLEILNAIEIKLHYINN